MLTELEQEAQADRFYMADAWFAKQGELAGWLWTQDQHDMANKLLVAATEMSCQWPGRMGLDLLSTFLYNRYIKEKAVGWKSPKEDPPF